MDTPNDVRPFIKPGSNNTIFDMDRYPPHYTIFNDNLMSSSLPGLNRKHSLIALIFSPKTETCQALLA